jgi:glycosyltransferase involved in cell wall biosynthesis
VYADVVKPFHRYVYHIKQHRIYRELRKKVSIEGVDLCHATTLFTDGGQAYKLFKRYHIPYLVAVRSTDYYAFLLKAPHTWPSAKKILLNASKIVFVSPTLKDKFCSHHYISKFLPNFEKKIIVSRNGIDDFWIDNTNRNDVPDNHSVLYVGTMIRRKRPLAVIEAVLQLKEKYPDIKVNLIGSTGEDEASVKQYAASNPEVVVYHGRINDKQRLLENYRNNSLFVLPSTAETFGLVYLEALSQNLPVIYTKGDGVDGFLPDNSGVGLITPSVESIKVAIEKVFDNRSGYSNKGIDFDLFRWSNIASEYSKMYSDIL